MKILYFDCFSGISGDMTLGALTDLLGDSQYLIGEMEKLKLDVPFQIQIGEAERHGIYGKTVKVLSDEKQPHRSFRTICKQIDRSAFSASVKQLSKKIFRRLAEAEANVHKKPVDEVHFHEIGAVDSIVDVVGAAVLLDAIRPDKICSSVLYDGTGFVSCRHGTIPVPVPATIEIVKRRGALLQLTDEQGEMVTPTGAAIICEAAESFGENLCGSVLKTGYGCGEREFKRPNILRVMLAESNGTAEEKIVKLETNIDDCSGEALGYTMEKLMNGGARDVFYTPVYMKKNRPAYLLTVICDSSCKEKLKKIIFSETTSIGIRENAVSRTKMDRTFETVLTKWGALTIKRVSYEGIEKCYPEYESAKSLAQQNGIPLSYVLNHWQK